MQIDLRQKTNHNAERKYYNVIASSILNVILKYIF